MRQPPEDEGLPPAAATRITVRAQTIRDVPSVLRVRTRSWRAAYAGIVPADYLNAMEPTPEAIAHGEERLRGLADRVHFHVAEVDGRIRGFVVAGPDRDVGFPTGEIWAIYVDPDTWGVGIGAALLATATDALGRAGHAPITLWVLEANVAARGFYERFGFVPTGERRHIELGAPIPEVRYVRSHDAPR